MKRCFTIVTIGMILLYSALTIGAASCAFMPTVQPAHVHHAPSHTGHSVFCAWACQVNPMESMHAAVLLLGGWVLVAIQRFVCVVPYTLVPAIVSRSRAPPQ